MSRLSGGSSSAMERFRQAFSDASLEVRIKRDFGGALQSVV